jgi:hypothetical protein
MVIQNCFFSTSYIEQGDKYLEINVMSVENMTEILCCVKYIIVYRLNAISL